MVRLLHVFQKEEDGKNIIRKPISSQPNKCFGIGSPIVINETTTVYTGYHIFKVLEILFPVHQHIYLVTIFHHGQLISKTKSLHE